MRLCRKRTGEEVSWMWEEEFGLRRHERKTPPKRRGARGGAGRSQISPRRDEEEEEDEEEGRACGCAALLVVACLKRCECAGRSAGQPLRFGKHEKEKAWRNCEGLRAETATIRQKSRFLQVRVTAESRTVNTGMSGSWRWRHLRQQTNYRIYRTEVRIF